MPCCGIGRFSGFICADKFSNDPLFKLGRKVQHLMRNVQLERHVRSVINVPLRAAGVELAQSNVLVAIQPHRRTRTVESLRFHELRRD